MAVLQSQHGMDVEEPHETAECAICFESVLQTTALPCACKVAYCAQCWDRALAQSFNSVGQARCPTCREQVCVDFDPERVCLVFSRAAQGLRQEAEARGVDARQALEDYKTEAVRKLRQQALPAQVRLLEEHGERNPVLHDMALAPEAQLRGMSESALRRHIIDLGGNAPDNLEKEDLVSLLRKEAEEKQALGCLLGRNFADATQELPSCVCGCSLERVSGDERTMRCCDKMLAGSSRDSQQYLDVFERLTLMQPSICFCDLCGKSVAIANAVWTCENGDSTILHATSYDVCDECFMRYACGRPRSCPDDSSTSDEDMIGECHGRVSV